jgi:ribonucleoside-diphosphate reductase alpha chain
METVRSSPTKEFSTMAPNNLNGTVEHTGKTVKSAVFLKTEGFEAEEGQEILKDRLIKKSISLSDNARVVLEKRYLKKDDDGAVIEGPEEMFFRVAQAIATAEKAFNKDAKIDVWTEKFYTIMTDLDFLPNSPTLMNAGRELGQLSACFVLPVGDSMEEIFESVKNTALIHKSGGGTGFSFSHIRPRNDRVKSTKGVSSGPLSFMRVFDVATETIKQGGTRRGANMGILECTHPEIMDFISVKETDGVLSNFNISVALTNQFMEALKKDGEYELINPHSKEPSGKRKASEVFKRIVELAWKNGEPGVIFLDKINADNPTPHIGPIESTNPCGEQPLLPYESCNLGSINLAHMVQKQGGKPEINYAKLSNIVRIAVRFLDNVIEVNNYPLPQIEKMTKGNRKIGLGVMGFADMLIQLGVPYNSHAAANIAEEVMKFIQEEARKVSAYLAQERGVFPNFKGSIYDREGKLKVRNATVTTIAPTGTISMIAECSSGIEPLFAIVYEKNVLDGQHFLEVHPEFKRVAQEEGFHSDELMKMVAHSGSLHTIYGIQKRIRDVFVTAHDIEPRWHVTIQAAFQKYTDNAVSKTVNFKKDATVADIEEVFLYAYDLGCKGITVYRDGSRKNQVITTGTGGDKNKPATVAPGMLHPRPRPAVTTGNTYKIKTGCGTLYVNINADDVGLCEIFTQMGKSGGCPASNSEAVSRLISLSLRSGVDPKTISEQLCGIRCPIPTWHEGKMILSCADAIGHVLQKGIEDRFGASETTGKKTAFDLGLCPQCPECGTIMEHQEGCAVCKTCGYSKCG